MKLIDTFSWFTPYIVAAIECGFTPEFDGCGGCDGKQIWRRGRECLILWADNHNNFTLDGICSVRTHTMYVSRLTLATDAPLANDSVNRWRDTWERHVVASKVYYAVAARSDADWWTDDLDVVRRARETQAARRVARRINHHSKTLPLTDELLAIVRRVKGFKTVDSRHITVTKKPYESTWWITNTKSCNYVCKSCDLYREW